MRTRLFHTIVAVSAAFAASASWGCGDAGGPEERKEEPPPDGAASSHTTASDGGSRAVPDDAGDAAMSIDGDAAIDVDAGWPPTK